MYYIITVAISLEKNIENTLSAFKAMLLVP
jgi:hypothetical protein